MNRTSARTERTSAHRAHRTTAHILVRGAVLNSAVSTTDERAS